MVLVIDTSSARSGVALLEDRLEPLTEVVRDSRDGFDLPAEVQRLLGDQPLSAIAVATGPGSFTGLRVGAAYAVGLALGRNLPLRPFPTLALQAARYDGEATAVAEAGRGRVYYLPAGGEPALGEAGELPQGQPVVGWLRPATADLVRAAGRTLVPESELRSFGAAASLVVRESREIPCDSLTLDYMQSFQTLR
ncbi:MAG TPA: tRNA (adenosine(37)-N6)-threonylcarbamoyltransferase complex dimerization subunit type 1 TsaB [Candidatus Dormibacteraeota bacterium]